jgi:dTDP-4-amino-4,6-dideoxygalactose transaminase
LKVISDAHHILERTLAERLGRKHCVLTGRAASAIHIAVRSLELRPGKIVVPAITCPSPASVPIYSGHQPLFCDISLRDFNLCPHALGRLLKDHSDIVAIMPVHLYGQAAPMHEIQAIADAYRLPVIEDAAQALGASLEGKPLGSWGDVSVISFGHTKTLDVGWGGAALTNDDDIATRLRLQAALLPEKPPHINELFEQWRRVYYSLIPLTEMNPQLHALFLPLPEIFEDMYLFGLDEDGAPSILQALQQLDDLVAARRHFARAYRAGLQHPALHHPVLDEEDAPWRYSFLVPAHLQRPITDALRAAKIDASNWYPSLHRWYASGREQGDSLFPNACRLSAEVVNLWVTPTLPQGRVEQTCEVIHKILAQNQ